MANGPDLDRRDRTLVTAAAIAPDFDGLGMLAELATRGSDDPLLWWSEYHHVIGHNLVFGIVVSLAALGAAKRRVATCVLAFVVFHLHLVEDLVGSKGPDGYDWPIPYLFPIIRDLELSWSGQWALNAWPNMAFTVVLLACTFYMAWLRGYSIVGLVSRGADEAFVSTLRQRFGEPGSTEAPLS